MMFWKRKDADMTMGKMVAAVIAVVLIVLLIMLAMRSGKLGAKALECAEGQEYCVKTAAECEKFPDHEYKTLKYCETAEGESGHCCEPALSFD